MPKSKVFEEALNIMNPESIKQVCAWVEAYRDINKIEVSECAGILTNRLKNLLKIKNG